MARNIFDLRFNLSEEKLSIKETALKLISLLELLRIEDDVFAKFKVSKPHFKSVDFDLNNGNIESNVQKLAKTLLIFEYADFSQSEKDMIPTIDFTRELGFMFLLEFKKENKQHFVITGSMGVTFNPLWNSLSIQNFPIENSDYDFNWYLKNLKIANLYLKPIYSCIRIILDQYMEKYWELKIKYPLGWITYFSNESNIKMPFDAGFEVLQEEKGQYIITTREDFTTSKESFFAMKDKLIEGMKLLKEKCPEYTEA